jgi:hypothetical protein
VRDGFPELRQSARNVAGGKFGERRLDPFS